MSLHVFEKDDPEARAVTVLVLGGGEYFPRSVFGKGETAENGDGFTVNVAEWFRSIEPNNE